MVNISKFNRITAIIRLKDSIITCGAKEALQQPIARHNPIINDLSSKSYNRLQFSIRSRNLFGFMLLLLLVINSNIPFAADILQQPKKTSTDTIIIQQWYYLAPEKRSIYDRFYKKIKRQLKSKNVIRIDSTSKILCETKKGLKKFFITAGLSALAKIQHCTKTSTIFGFYLTQQQFQQLSKKSKNAYKNSNIFFADQPLIRQLALARYFLPKSNSVGMIYHKSVQHQIDYFNHRKPTFINLSEFMINSSDDILSQLSKATAHSDFILAVIDNETFNSTNAKSILLSTYRKSIPLFGGTRGFVRAGIVASCYSDPSKLVDELTNYINTQLQSSGVRQYPLHFEIEQNEAVSHSMNLKTSKKSDIKTFITETLLLWRNL